MLIGNGGSDFLPSTSNNPEDSFALFHDVNSNFKLVAEYSMYESETRSTGAAAEEFDTLALGAVVTF